MDAKDVDLAELLQSRSEIMSVLDVKCRDILEWRTFRAIDRIVFAATGAAQAPLNGTAEKAATRTRRRVTEHPSYADLAVELFDQLGHPVPTPELFAYIQSKRPVGDDPKKARVNVQSALSRNDKIASVPWRGARAWWHADKTVPPERPVVALPPVPSRFTSIS